MRKSLKKIAATLAACAMALTMAATVVPTDAAAETSKAGKKAAKADFNADGTYHAYFGFQQTGSWIFRDEWYSDTLGIDGSSFKDTDINFDNGTLFKSDTNGITAVDGTVVTDAEITGNGTYTVSVEGLSGVLATDTESKCSMVYVDTDIPWSAKDNPVTISDVKLTVDGRDVSLPSDIFFPSEYIDASGLLRFDVVNSYQADKGEYAESPDIMVPGDSIKVTFTISGFNNDNPDAVEAPAEDEGATSDAAATSEVTAESESSSSPIVPIVIVVVVVVVIVVAVVVVKKKNN